MPANPSDERPIEIVTFSHWLRWLVGPWIAVGVVMTVAALAGYEPSSGGWPGLLAPVGAVLVAYTMMVGGFVPNVLVVYPDRVCQRIRGRSTVIRAQDVTAIELHSNGGIAGGRGVRVRSTQGTISVPGNRSEVRQAIDGFTRAAGEARTAHGGFAVADSAWAGLVIPESSASRRRSRLVRTAITGGACLTALVGLLRLLVG